MKILIIDATGKKILIGLIVNKNIYTGTYINSKKNYDKLIILVNKFILKHKTNLDKIKRIALKEKLEIITTEKDYKRLTNKNKKSIKFLKVELKIENFKKFKNFLKEKI